jgi:polysaccharide pyruvyl transferase CsaB
MGRSILIAGYYGFGNLGDEAILTALADGLRRHIDDVEICVVGGNPRSIEEQHENVTAVDWRDLTGLLESARQADLLILGGGGIFHDYWEIDPATILTPDYGGIAYYSSIPLLAHLLNKPCQIFSVGVGPLRTEEGRNYTRLAFELAQEASVRDRESKELLASIGVQGLDETRVSCDPTLLLEPAPDPQVRAFLQSQGLNEEIEYVAVNLRHWDFDVDPDFWPQEVARALDNILTETESHILFIPFQAVDRTPYENDLARIRDVQA